MTKFQCQMNIKVYISNLNFVIWIYLNFGFWHLTLKFLYDHSLR